MVPIVPTRNCNSLFSRLSVKRAEATNRHPCTAAYTTSLECTSAKEILRSPGKACCWILSLLHLQFSSYMEEIQKIYDFFCKRIIVAMLSESICETRDSTRCSSPVPSSVDDEDPKFSSGTDTINLEGIKFSEFKSLNSLCREHSNTGASK